MNISPENTCVTRKSTSRLDTEQLYLDTQAETRHQQNRGYAGLRILLSKLLRTELGRSHTRLSEDVFEDLVQDLLLSAYQKDLPRFDPSRGSLVGFLRSRVHWSLMNYFRAHRNDLSVEDVETASATEPTDERTAEARLLCVEEVQKRQEVARVVNASIKAVRDKRVRRALWHYDILGEPMKKVSKRLNIHPSTVGRVRQQGLAMLRVSLASCAWAAVPSLY